MNIYIFPCLSGSDDVLEHRIYVVLKCFFSVCAFFFSFSFFILSCFLLQRQREQQRKTRAEAGVFKS